MTEAILLGNVAMQAGGPIEYDTENVFCITNNRDAQQASSSVEYRKGWKMPS
jgi:hypothetical protein